MSAGKPGIEAVAFWIEAVETGALRPVALQPCGAGQVRVRTLYTAISRGTESLVFRGLVPEAVQQQMRAPHQAGSFGFPIKYGYSAVGTVVEGEGIGRTVFCLYPHQSGFCVQGSAVVEVPEAVPPQRAVLAANMETALNATWDARVAAGDRVVVVGAGVVGCLVAYLCGRMPGTQVELVDIDEGKAAVAQALGVTFRSPAQLEPGADVVFHASASQTGLQTALDVAGREAAVVELSWYGTRSVQVELGRTFHPDRVRLISSQVGTIPPHQAARWTYGRRMSVALELLGDPALDVLFSGESDFAELPSVMRTLCDDKAASGVLCHRIRYAQDVAKEQPSI